MKSLNTLYRSEKTHTTDAFTYAPLENQAPGIPSEQKPHIFVGTQHRKLWAPLFFFGLILLTTLLLHAQPGQTKTGIDLRQFDTGHFRELSIWHQHITTDIDNEYGMSMQITPFYQTSIDTNRAGKTFGTGDANTLTIASDRFELAGETKLPYHSVKHDISGSASTENTATIRFAPQFENYGATISLFQDCSKMHDRLSCLIETSVLHTKTELPVTGTNTDIKKYFSGEQLGTKQTPLAYGKLGTEEKTILGPLKVTCSYNLVETEKSFVGLTGGFSFPTQKQTNQNYLFSASSPGAGQTKLILGLDLGTKFWENEKTSAELLFSGHYYHLCKDKTKKILGVTDNDGSELAFSSYRLFGEKGIAGVTPGANFLHQEVNRSHRGQFELSALFAGTHEQVTGNIGYALFARQSEQIERPTLWDNAQYARARAGYNTDSAFDPSNSSKITAQGRYITRDMLTLDPAEQNSQLSGTLFAGIGYAPESANSPFPVLFGLGGSYEYSFTDSLPGSLSAWAKVGVSF